MGVFILTNFGRPAVRPAAERVLAQGGSVYFDSSEPHAYRGIGKGGALAVVVTTPPRL